MSTHNIFHWEIRKLILRYLLLTGAMEVTLYIVVLCALFFLFLFFLFCKNKKATHIVTAILPGVLDGLHEAMINWGKGTKLVCYTNHIWQSNIASDWVSFFHLKSTDIFLLLHENNCCGCSLEVPQWGTSNEYPQHVSCRAGVSNEYPWQHMFSYRNKKNNSGYPCLSGAMK